MSRIVQLTSALATLFEFVLATALLAFFASAYPDLYCTALWRVGGSKESYSKFSFRMYLRANYLEIPPMPLIWDERSTQYNLCVAIITMILWVVRLCIRGRTLDIYGTIMSNVLYDIILIALWSYSVVTQSSGDFLDSKHLYPRQWSLDHKCNEVCLRNLGACEAAKASFGLAIFAVVWFGIRCLSTCMYGAYTYGRSFQDTDSFCHNNKKAFDGA